MSPREYQVFQVQALERRLERFVGRLAGIERLKEPAAHRAIALSQKADVERALVEARAVLVAMTAEHVCEKTEVRLKPGPKRIMDGFGMKLGAVGVMPAVRLAVPTESHGTREGENNNPETIGDGCGSWGRSWAQKTGIHSLRNLVSKMDAQAEMRKRLRGPTYIRDMAGRDQRRAVSDAAVVEIMERSASALAEIESWSEDIEEVAGRTISRTLVWK